MVKANVKYLSLLIVVSALLIFSGITYAGMGMNGNFGMGMNDSGGMGLNGNNGPGMFGRGHMASTRVGLGMMNGMTGAPIVGDDGTAYLVSYVKSGSGSTPNTNSFLSTVTAFTASGQSAAISLKGIVSRPVISGNTLIATASLSDPGNFTMMGNDTNTGAPGQSVIYGVTLPLSANSQPTAISMDGRYASAPVIAANHIYVITSDYGNAMIGSDMFNAMFGNYNFNKNGTAKSYLYIYNMDWSLASKTEIQ